MSLIRLAALIEWERFDDAFGPLYHEARGRRGLPTRLMAGLHLLKHMKGLSDDETCAAWLENPYFQAFCGETHFQHRLPFDRSSMTPSRRCMHRLSGKGWRKRIAPPSTMASSCANPSSGWHTGRVRKRHA